VVVTARGGRESRNIPLAETESKSLLPKRRTPNASKGQKDEPAEKRKRGRSDYTHQARKRETEMRLKVIGIVKRRVEPSCNSRGEGTRGGGRRVGE